MNVYLKSSNDDLGNAIWTRSGNQGDRWNSAKIDITSSDSDRYLVIEGVVGKGYLGDQVNIILNYKIETFFQFSPILIGYR